ncbi:hypothetical protein [Capnocytophaga genosp. AHN8471]|uniref:hypothetical protein n=1 Tax=Capnocytophaga genosp. AHN8471 TaxID=327574 RepID=UPI0019339F21|nr:hypothetical protein [Capnocytophaga genosp. AHN8471]MBM0660431.1 hypothetical protein [Capnocytophaga genosp. AHN8471]
MKKIKRYKWKSYLYKAIIEKPSDTKKNTFEYGTIRADDQFYINDMGYGVSHIDLYVGIIFYSLSLISLVSNKDTIEDRTIFSIIFFIIGSFSFLYYYKNSKKLLVLDRLNGMVTYPGFLFSKPCSVPFDELLASVASFANAGASLVFYHYNGITGISIFTEDCKLSGNWSFIVWYMDKNRPLPPGEAFDPYRKKDFQRRKSEGFPPPLYPSYIDTPEDSESQKELSQLHREEKQKRLEKKRRKRKDK